MEGRAGCMGQGPKSVGSKSGMIGDSELGEGNAGCRVGHSCLLGPLSNIQRPLTPVLHDQFSSSAAERRNGAHEKKPP